MALTQKDLQQIKNIVEDVVEVKLEEKLEQKFNEKMRDYATRDEMRQDMKELLSNYADRNELDDKLAELRNDFYNKVDPFLAEISESRSERDMYAEKIYNHEDRIETLETWQQDKVKLAI